MPNTMVFVYTTARHLTEYKKYAATNLLKITRNSVHAACYRDQASNPQKEDDVSSAQGNRCAAKGRVSMLG